MHTGSLSPPPFALATLRLEGIAEPELNLYATLCEDFNCLDTSFPWILLRAEILRPRRAAVS